MRSYWEEQIYIIVSSIANEPAVYKIRPEHNPKGKTRTVHRYMMMHCDSLLDNFDWNIREPASQNHPVQGRTDRKTRMTSERIQDQSQESQSTSNESDKGDINFASNQWRFLEGVGREKKNKPNNRSDCSSNNLNENKHEDNSATHIKASERTSSATDMKASQRTSSATDIKASQAINSATDTEAFRSISSATDEKARPGKMGKVEKGVYYGTREE